MAGFSRRFPLPFLIHLLFSAAKLRRFSHSFTFKMKQKLFKTSLFNSPFCRNLCGCIPNISNSGAAFPPFRYGTRCDSGLSIRSALSVQCRKHIVRCRRKSAAFCDGKYGTSDDEVRHFPMRSAALSHALLRGGFSGLRIRFSQSRFSPFPASVITVYSLRDFRFRPL